MKKIVCRVDSGTHIGIGHVMRCLTLAQKLKKDNFEFHFITKDHAGFTRELIAEQFPLKVLGGGVQRTLSTLEKTDYKTWLGQTPEEDLIQTNQYLKEIGGADLFIVDHYSLDACYEEKIQAKTVMAIDDLMNRQHACELLLDQNITAQKENYQPLMKKKETHYLMGPSFALLRAEFQKLREVVDQNLFGRPVKKILVFFGGADEQGYTLKFARSLKPAHFKKYNFTFVQNQGHPDFSFLQELQQKNLDIKLLGFVEDFAGLMLSSDLFIGAGGTTSWERACLGVASAIVAVADNQVGNCVLLHRTNSVYYLGPAEEMSPAKWASFFDEIVPDSSIWYRCRKNSFQLVDGLGTQRVVDEIGKVLSC